MDEPMAMNGGHSFDGDNTSQYTMDSVDTMESRTKRYINEHFTQADHEAMHEMQEWASTPSTTDLQKVDAKPTVDHRRPYVRKCWCCRSRDHVRRFCPFYVRKCWTCQSPWHIKRFCPVYLDRCYGPFRKHQNGFHTNNRRIWNRGRPEHHVRYGHNPFQRQNRVFRDNSLN